MSHETAIVIAAFAFILLVLWRARTTARREDAEERDRDEKYSAMKRDAPLLNRERN